MVGLQFIIFLRVANLSTYKVINLKLTHMDPIADMLTRIRNAQLVKKPTVEIPFSKIKWEIVKILEAHKLIKGAEKKGRKDEKFIEVSLKYDDQNSPAIMFLRRVSKPGRRVYIRAKDIFPSRSKLKILSTPKGLLTDREAKKQNVGGEVICEVG